MRGTLYLPLDVLDEVLITTLTVSLPLYGISPTVCCVVPCNANDEPAGVVIWMLPVTPPVFTSSSCALKLSPGVMARGFTETVFTTSDWCWEIWSGIETCVFL